MQLFHKNNSAANKGGQVPTQSTGGGRHFFSRIKSTWTTFVDQLGSDPFTDWAFTFALNVFVMVLLIGFGFWIYADTGAKFKSPDVAVEIKKPKISVQTFARLNDYFATKKATEASLVSGSIVSPDPSK